jgi:hypothetical protein
MCARAARGEEGPCGVASRCVLAGVGAPPALHAGTATGEGSQRAAQRACVGTRTDMVAIAKYTPSTTVQPGSNCSMTALEIAT